MAARLRNDPVAGPRYRRALWRDRQKPKDEDRPKDNKPALADLRRALDDSAKQVRTSFVWFVTVSTYFAVLVGTTTHEQLFLGQSIKIPVVDVTLPIDAVYLVAPLVYFVIYVSFLVQSDGLGQLLARYKAELDALSEERRQHEMTITTDLAFVNLYLRTSNSRTVTFLTWSIFIIAFFAIPLVITLLFQVNFLPYKHDWLTYYHMALVAITAGLSVYFWFRFGPALRLHGRKLPSDVLMVVLPVGGMLCAISSMLIFVPEQSWIDANIGASLLSDTRSNVSRSLNLRGLGLGDMSKVVTIKGRDLSNADFSGARLTNVEFVNSTLNGVEFQRSLLRNVRFTCRDDVFDEFDFDDCSVDVVDMSGAVLHGVQMEGLTFNYLNLRSTIIIKSRLAFAANVTSLENSKIWGSILGNAESFTDKTHRTIGWTYVGRAMLRDSTLFVDGPVSGLHHLTFAVKATIATDGAEGATAPLATIRRASKESKDLGRLFLVEYYRSPDFVNEQRRWDLALEPYEAGALFIGPADAKAKGASAEAPAKDGEREDVSASAPCQPLPNSPAGSLSSCTGPFGYDVGKKQPIGAENFVQLLETAENACSSAASTLMLSTSVTSFLGPVLSEQVVGRNLSVLGRVLLPTSKTQPETPEQFEKRKETARKQVNELMQKRGKEVAELTHIWSALSRSPCLCEKVSSDSLVIRRIAGNLAALKVGAPTARAELVCTKHRHS